MRSNKTYISVVLCREETLRKTLRKNLRVLGEEGLHNVWRLAEVF